MRGVRPGRKREEAKLTEEYLGGLEPRAARFWVWDTGKVGGFAVLVHPSGIMTFYLVRRHGGKVEKLTFGTWPKVKVAAARDRAAAQAGEYGKGKSPVQAKRAEKAATLAAEAAARARVPLSEAWGAYKVARLANADARRVRAVRFEEWTWGKHLAETFGSKAVDALTRSETARWFLEVTAKAGPVGANRARALLSGILSFWAGQVEADLPNPCRGVKPNRETGRERYLSAGELRAWWKAVLAAPVDTGELLAVLSFTAARQGTLRAMRWEELGWQGRTWRIPGPKMKAGVECVLPLNGPAFGVLRARWERAGKPPSGWVFPSPWDGKPRRELREIFNAAVKAAGLVDVTPHDCRRTAATAAADADVDSAVVSHLLGHVDKSVLGRYRKVTAPKAAEASARMAAALLRPAGLLPDDFKAGLPAPEVMRPEAEAAALLPFPGVGA